MQSNDDQAVKSYKAALNFYEGEIYSTIDDYDHVIRIDSTSLSAYKERVELYKEYGLYDEAIDDYSKIIELSADDYYLTDYYFSRARLYDHQGHPDKARADFIKAIELESYSYNRTVVDYDRVIELAPDFAPAYYLRARTRYDNFELNHADYSKAIELDPSYLAAYEARADLYEKQGMYEQAISDYSKIIELKPDAPSGYFRRGQAQATMKNFDQALVDLLVAQELTTDLILYEQIKELLLEVNDSREVSEHPKLLEQVWKILREIKE